jgi:hypothetical protein
MNPISAGIAAALCFAAAAYTADGGTTTETTQTIGLPQATCTAWNRTATISLRGTTEAGGLSGTFAMKLDAPSGRYAAERSYDLYTEAEGFDGKLDWAQDRSGASHFLDSGPAQAISITQAWLRRRGWCEPVTDPLEINPLPDEMDTDTAESVWSVTPHGGIPVILRFDRATGLMRQSEIRLWGNRLIRHYAVWRDIGRGIVMPLSERDEDPEDESVETIQLTRIKAGGPARVAAAFAKPGRPHDYAILGGADSTTVAYEDDGIGRIYVPVLIDGKGPFAFEVDTGGHLILTTGTASQLQLNATGNFSNTGAGTGIAHAGLVRTREIRIGSAVIRNQVAKVLPLSVAANDRGQRPPRAGILGLELFERFAVQLDRAAKTMTLTPLEAFKGTPKGLPLPIRFTEDAPLTAGTFDGIAGDFELDSGDAGPAIIEGYWAQQQGLAARLGQGLLWSGGAAGGDYREILNRGDFTLGPLNLPREVVSYVGLVERGSESTRMQAGVIGESSLYRFDMTYDYEREYVWIDPASKVATPRPFNRVGLRLKRDTPDSFSVTLVVPDSPAAAAGLRPGDKILAIDTRPASQLSVSDAGLIFAGPVGADVELLVAPKEGGDRQPRHIQLKELLL